jgi:acyl-CoA hydrolase
MAEPADSSRKASSHHVRSASRMMLDWEARYREKVRTPEQAIATIRRGDKVFIGSGAAEPQVLVKALIDSAGRLADTRIMHIMTLGVAPYTEEKFTDQFRHNAFFIGANTRKAVAEGRADYTPVFLSEIPALFRSGHMPTDVALIQVSVPDNHGFCSYGSRPTSSSLRPRARTK